MQVFNSCWKCYSISRILEKRKSALRNGVLSRVRESVHFVLISDAPTQQKLLIGWIIWTSKQYDLSFSTFPFLLGAPVYYCSFFIFSRILFLSQSLSSWSDTFTLTTFRLIRKEWMVLRCLQYKGVIIQIGLIVRICIH